MKTKINLSILIAQKGLPLYDLVAGIEDALVIRCRKEELDSIKDRLTKVETRQRVGDRSSAVSVLLALEEVSPNHPIIHDLDSKYKPQYLFLVSNPDTFQVDIPFNQSMVSSNPSDTNLIRPTDYMVDLMDPRGVKLFYKETVEFFQSLRGGMSDDLERAGLLKEITIPYDLRKELIYEVLSSQSQSSYSRAQINEGVPASDLIEGKVSLRYQEILHLAVDSYPKIFSFDSIFSLIRSLIRQRNSSRALLSDELNRDNSESQDQVSYKEAPALIIGDEVVGVKGRRLVSLGKAEITNIATHHPMVKRPSTLVEEGRVITLFGHPITTSELRGLNVIAGTAGSGKTTALHRLSSDLTQALSNDEVRTIKIVGPYGEPPQVEALQSTWELLTMHSFLLGLLEGELGPVIVVDSLSGFLYQGGKLGERGTSATFPETLLSLNKAAYHAGVIIFATIRLPILNALNPYSVEESSVYYTLRASIGWLGMTTLSKRGEQSIVIQSRQNRKPITVRTGYVDPMEMEILGPSSPVVINPFSVPNSTI